MDWPGGSWEATARLVATGAIAYVILLWLSLVVWAYRDIRERTQDIFYQVIAILLVLLFSLAGLVVYLMVRPGETLAEAYQRSLEEEAILRDLGDLSACPTCRRSVQADFIICPACRTPLKEPCAKCSRPLSYSWEACPYCATNRSVATATADDGLSRGGREPRHLGEEERPHEQRPPVERPTAPRAEKSY